MTNQHPITPPPELVSEWTRNRGYSCSSELWDYLATQAAQWGADQELEACCEWLDAGLRTPYVAIRLRSDRRSRPPSLRKQAYDALDTYIYGEPDPKDKERTYNTIRKALEALPND